MYIRVGYELIFQCAQSTPMILNLSVHQSRASDLQRPDIMRTEPRVPMHMYHDAFGNWCTRIVAPPGRIRLTADTMLWDSGQAEPSFPSARQQAVESLPQETLVYLLGSRYCDTDLLQDFAWRQFGHLPLGWPRVQAVCDFVHPQRLSGMARTARRMSRLCSSGHHLVPLPEHTRAVLHWLSGRHWRTAGPFPHGFCRMDGGVSRRCLACIRSAPQSTTNRTRADGAGSRCGRRPDQHGLRCQYSRELQGLDG